MTQKFSNNATSKLAAALAPTDMTLQVSPGDGDLFPAVGVTDSNTFKLKVTSATKKEILTISQRAAGADLMTISARAVEAVDKTAPAAQSFAINDVVSLTITAGALDQFAAEPAAAAHVADTTAAHAASAISATPGGVRTGSDVQAQLDELDADIGSTISAHLLDPDPHPQYDTAAETAAAIAAAIAPLAVDTAVVHKTGDETIAGIKTFSSPPVIPDATAANEPASKGQMDTADAATLTAAESYAASAAAAVGFSAFTHLGGHGTKTTGTVYQNPGPGPMVVVLSQPASGSANALGYLSADGVTFVQACNSYTDGSGWTTGQSVMVVPKLTYYKIAGSPSAWDEWY